MARFIGKVRGAHAEVSRLDSARSGLEVTVNGWGAGVQVAARTRGDADEFDVWVTRGSGGGGGLDWRVATVTHNTVTGTTTITTEEAS